MSMDQDAQGLASRALTAAAIAPLQVGLIAQWDMSTLGALADGAVIRTVGDASGNGNILFQSASGFQATKATDANGKAVARFNGSTTQLKATTLGSAEPNIAPVTAPITLVMVVKPPVAASQASASPVLFQGAGTNPLTISILNDSTNHTGNVFVGGNALSNNSGQFLGSIQDGAYHIIALVADGSQANLYVDGYWCSTVSGNLLGSASLTTPVLGFQQIGNANYFSGDYAEVRLWNRRLTATELFSVCQTLNAKWSVGIPLYSNSLDGQNVFEDGTASDGSNYRIWSPGNPSPTPTVVFWCHQQAGDRNITPAFFAYAYVRAALAMGYYVVASDMGFTGSPGGSASSWGNATAQNALAVMYSTMATRLGSNPNVLLVGASMGGGAAALAYAKGTFPAGKVKAMYLVDPALSLWSMYQTTYYSSIDSGYGMTTGTLSSAASQGATSISTSVSYAAGTILAVETGTTNVELVTVAPAGPTGAGPYSIPLTTALANAHASGVRVSDYGTKTVGNDPMLLTASTFQGLPIRYTASSADTTVVQSSNATAFQTKVSGIANDNTIVQHQGGHLNGTSAQARDFISFVKARTGL